MSWAFRRCTLPVVLLACAPDGSAAPSPRSEDSQDSAVHYIALPDTAADAVDSPVCGTESFGGIDFVKVCASTFEMGCTAGQTGCDTDETAHTVTLTHDYWVATTEATQAQFEGRVGFNPSLASDCAGDCPVDRTSPHHGMVFANALSAEAGRPECYSCTGSGVSVLCVNAMDPYVCDGYRLLTEAEWEGAARCGTDLRYSGSDVVLDVAWIDQNSTGHIAPVAQLQPNACGLYDMSGNVWEWSQDVYGVYDEGPSVDPVGAPPVRGNVGRGGTWDGPDWGARVAFRHNPHPTDGNNNGFRIARTDR